MLRSEKLTTQSFTITIIRWEINLYARLSVQKAKQILEPCKRIEIAVEHLGDGDTSCNWYTWNGS